MRKQKAPEALISKILAQLTDEKDVEVWPENHTAVILFLTLQTQWDRNQMDNSITNLKWPSIEIAIRRNKQAQTLSQDDQDQLFSDITTMERHAIKEQRKIKAEQ